MQFLLFANLVTFCGYVHEENYISSWHFLGPILAPFTGADIPNDDLVFVEADPHLNFREPLNAVLFVHLRHGVLHHTGKIESRQVVVYNMGICGK
mgnify:CR=1 FL=1